MKPLPLYVIDPQDEGLTFPPIKTACESPNGLLAVGGDLSAARLIKAYGMGIFPWFDDDQPILWWSPNPRSVIIPGQVRVSRSTRKSLRHLGYHFSFNKAFSQVMLGCAAPRKTQQGTWITEEMHQAYTDLHAMGYAHSVEVWKDNELVGGLYGVALGKVFFGESMFSHARDASKCGFALLDQHFCQWGYQLIDCQVESTHMTSLGARPMDRGEFKGYLDKFCADDQQYWEIDANIVRQLTAII